MKEKTEIFPEEMRLIVSIFDYNQIDIDEIYHTKDFPSVALNLLNKELVFNTDRILMLDRYLNNLEALMEENDIASERANEYDSWKVNLKELKEDTKKIFSIIDKIRDLL